jgi:hypothetical protein
MQLGSWIGFAISIIVGTRCCVMHVPGIPCHWPCHAAVQASGELLQRFYVRRGHCIIQWLLKDAALANKTLCMSQFHIPGVALASALPVIDHYSWHQAATSRCYELQAVCKVQTAADCRSICIYLASASSIVPCGFNMMLMTH